MFRFSDSDVGVRTDIGAAFAGVWSGLAAPGPTLSGEQRIHLAGVARDGTQRSAIVPEVLQDFANQLMERPAVVGAREVRTVADAVGDATTVETVAVVSILSAVDGFHDALGIDRESLPIPGPGEPTGEIRHDLKRRRTHLPMPAGPIPVALDMVPSDARLYLSLQGPLYMTDEEMSSDVFARDPGLNRAQMELISARLSFLNQCFY